VLQCNHGLSVGESGAATRANENLIDKNLLSSQCYNYNFNMEAILMANSPRKIWVSWRENKQRYEVGFHWEGYDTPFRFFSWRLPNGKSIPFTKENKNVADEFKIYLYGQMAPDIKTGISKFNPIKLTGTRKTKNTLDIFFDEIFIKEYETKIKTKDVCAEYVGLLKGYHKNHIQPVLGETSLYEIDELAIKKFYLALSEKTISKSQIENVMDLLNLIMKEASEIIPSLDYPKFPKYKSKKSKRREKIKWLSEDEQDLVLSYVEEIHKPVAMVYLYYGLRSQEVINLKRSDLQVVNKQGNRIPVLYVKTLKGGNDRNLRIDSHVYEILAKLTPAFCGSLFHYEGKPYYRKTLYKIVRRALDKAGFEDVSPKDASRHSRASQLGNRGASSFEIQYQLGHADVRTSEIYTHISSDKEGRFLRKTPESIGEQLVNS
jgi:integrase